VRTNLSRGYSLLCGKEQGISRLLRTSDPHQAPADPRDHSGFPENSLESGTGKFHNGSGNSNSLILGPIRELLAGVRARPQKAAGTSNGWSADKKTPRVAPGLSIGCEWARGKGDRLSPMRLRNSRCGSSGLWRPLKAQHPIYQLLGCCLNGLAGSPVASEMVFASRASTDGRLGDDLRSTSLCLVKTPTTKKKLQLYYHRPRDRKLSLDSGRCRTRTHSNPELRRAVAKREKVIEHGVEAGSISICRRICRTR
jgi:hypothetical protein